MQTYAKQIYEQYTTMSVSELVDYYTAHPELIGRLSKYDRLCQVKECTATSQESAFSDTEEAMNLESEESIPLHTEASANKIRTIGLYYHSLRMGGVERVISLLIPVWLQAGYKVVLMTQEEPSSADFDIPAETVRVVLPLDTSGLENRLVKFEEALLSHEIDLFIYHEWTDYKMFPEMLVVKRQHIPFILYTHGSFSSIYDFIHDYTLNSHKIFAMCDKVLALSDINYQFYALCGCPVQLIQNPIAKELQQITPVHSEESCHRVLWVGRFSDEKRPQDALRVMRHVCDLVPDAVLDLVGTGTEEQINSLRTLCGELGLEKQVIFHGRQRDVARFYKEAALVLITSETEGYPNVVIEAKAYGRAIAMYDLPYLTMLKNGLGVRKVDKRNPKVLAEAVAQILTDVQLRNRLEDEAVHSFEEFKAYDQTALWNDMIREMEVAEMFVTDQKTDSVGEGIHDDRNHEPKRGIHDDRNHEPKRGIHDDRNHEPKRGIHDDRNHEPKRGVHADSCHEQDSNQMCKNISASLQDSGPLMISMLMRDINIAYKNGMKSVELYPDFKIGKALLKIPRMIKRGVHREKSE